jgi:hypothetical protein
MSRCAKWNGTYGHVANYLMDKKGISDNKSFDVAKKLIYDYTNSKEYVGSFSDRVMFVRSNFSSFMSFLNKNIVNNESSL